MKPEELKEKLNEYPSNLPIAIVEGWTNEHIYDNLHAGYVHISGDENYFEISFDLPMKFIFKYLWIRFKRLFWRHHDYFI